MVVLVPLVRGEEGPCLMWLWWWLPSFEYQQAIQLRRKQKTLRKRNSKKHKGFLQAQKRKHVVVCWLVCLFVCVWLLVVGWVWLVVGCWLGVVGCRLLVGCGWLSVVGCGLSAVGGRLSVFVVGFCCGVCCGVCCGFCCGVCCGVCCGFVVAVVVVVRTVQLMRCVCPYRITDASNYGSRVPVDTAPGPVLCRGP